MSMAKSTKQTWQPGTMHPAILDEVHGGCEGGMGTFARVQTALGVVACWPGCSIVPDGDGFAVERPDGSRVVPQYRPDRG